MTWKFSYLVIANVTASSDELLAALKERAESRACGFTLLVPATGGGAGGVAAGRDRLEQALTRMREAGLEVEGQIGDPDPVAALHDVWDPQRFDEVIVSTLPTGASQWLQVDLPHRVEKLTGVPVSHVVAAERKPQPRTHRVEKPERRGVLAPFAALVSRGRSTRT